jgi:hypothetical protein
LSRRFFAKNSFHKVSTEQAAWQRCANHSRKTYLAARIGAFWMTEGKLLWCKQADFLSDRSRSSQKPRGQEKDASQKRQDAVHGNSCYAKR